VPSPEATLNLKLDSFRVGRRWSRHAERACYTSGPPGPVGIEFFGNPEDMETTKVCHFYLEGTYKYLMRGEFIEGSFFVPLFFKVAERSITSLPIQETSDPWRPWRYTTGPGFTMQSGPLKPA
jgi:hypothetical protein